MDELNTNQSNLPETPPTKGLKKSWKRSFFIFGGILILILVGLGFSGQLGDIFSRRLSFNGDAAIGKTLGAEPSDSDYEMPKQEKNRVDFLIMGIRGKDDVENGGLLTDTMMVLSYDKETKKASLISIPRDLYVKITDQKKDKLNSAFERLGLSGTKKLFSRITGVYIDNIIIFDFSSFQEIVDAVGGVDVTLARPFTETQQWGYEFSLPAGPNHLDGQNALYYVRSRYSSSDFDRAERQQQVILALKKKIVSLDLLTDPGRTISLVNTIRKNIQTDINFLDISGLLQLATQLSDSSKLQRHVLTTENLLYEDTGTGTYYLMPQGGNLEQIQQFFQDVLRDPTPTPTVSPA